MSGTIPPSPPGATDSEILNFVSGIEATYQRGVSSQGDTVNASPSLGTVQDSQSIVEDYVAPVDTQAEIPPVSRNCIGNCKLRFCELGLLRKK